MANTNSQDAGGSAAKDSNISTDYPHLFNETVAFLEQPIEERIRYVYRDKFILHANAKKVLGAMKDIYNRPKDVVRPPCLAVIGNSNEGKSAVAKRFFNDLGGDAARFFGVHDEMPVVTVEMPSRSTEPRVCLAIARALGLTAYGSATKSRMVTDNVMRALVAKKVQMLILSEFQHIMPLPAPERQVVYDFIKGITNHGISVVGIGTEEARLCMAHDPQIANRMRVVRLNSFANDRGFFDFLHSLEYFYPLPKPSGLGAEAMAKEIYSRTNGITGEVVSLCNSAAAYAIRKKLPCIDLDTLKAAALFPTASAA
jgi:alpha-D-ribose 1-methylphosphonate 5-triphosphate synthase subunit PhnL